MLKRWTKTITSPRKATRISVDPNPKNTNTPQNEQPGNKATNFFKQYYLILSLTHTVHTH